MINKIETLYVKKASAYIAFERFETFQRPSDMNITDYLNEFKRLYHDIQRFKITLPSAVLAHRVLKCSNLTKEKQQLARATLADLNYENMKKKKNLKLYTIILQYSQKTVFKLNQPIIFSRNKK